MTCVKITDQLITDAVEQAQGRHKGMKERFDKGLKRLCYAAFDPPKAPTWMKKSDEQNGQHENRFMVLLAAIGVFSMHNWGRKDPEFFGA